MTLIHYTRRAIVLTWLGCSLKCGSAMVGLWVIRARRRLARARVCARGAYIILL